MKAKLNFNLEKVLFSAVAEKINPEKVKEYFPIANYGEVVPIVYNTKYQISGFVSLLCDTANKGKNLRLLYNRNKCGNFSIFKVGGGDISLSNCAETWQAKPEFYCINLNDYEDFENLKSEIMNYISNKNVRAIFIEDIAKYQIYDFNKIQSDLKGIAESQNVCIFVGCKNEFENQIVYNREKIVLTDDNINNTNLTIYSFPSIGIYGVFSYENNIVKTNKDYYTYVFAKYDLQKYVKGEIEKNKLLQILFGHFHGTYARSTIKEIIRKCIVIGYLKEINNLKVIYICDTNSVISPIVTAEKKQEYALFSKKDIKKEKKSGRVGILKFGEFRCVPLKAECDPFYIVVFLLSAIFLCSIADIKVNQERKKVLLVTTKASYLDEIEFFDFRDSNSTVFLKQFNDNGLFVYDYIDPYSSNCLEKLNYCITNNKPDYIFIDLSEYNCSTYKSLSVKLSNIAKDNNIAIICFCQEENLLNFKEDLTFDEFWGFDNTDDKTRDINNDRFLWTLSGIQNGIYFRCFAFTENDVFRNPKSKEVISFIYENCFYGMKNVPYDDAVKIANENIELFDFVIDKKDIRKAQKMGIVKIVRKAKKKFVTYISPTER